MARYQRKHYRRRGHLRFGRLYGLLSALIIIAAIVVGCVVFFRVNTVEVTGNVRYTEEEIVETAGIEYGSNMFLFNKFESIDALLQNLAYVEEVSIRRDMPSTIRITVQECTVAAAVQDGDSESGKWWYINAEGKLLEQMDEPGDSLPVTGLTLLIPKAGETITVPDDQQLQRAALLALLASMESRGLMDNTQSIDFSVSGQVQMRYDNRLTVKLGLNDDFDYQMRVLTTIMDEYVNAKWTASDTGVLDLTNPDGRPHLIRDAN